MMKAKKDDLVEWLKEEMLKKIPAKFFKKYTVFTERSTAYELICIAAGLRPESQDVQRAFKELCGEAK